MHCDKTEKANPHTSVGFLIIIIIVTGSWKSELPRGLDNHLWAHHATLVTF